MEIKAIATFPEPAMAEHAATAKPVRNQANEALQDILFGSIAGTVGKVVEYPFDTVKVRLQSQPDHLPLRYAGPLDCFRQSIAQDGIRSLYRGVSAPLAGAAAETACLFWTYGVAKDVLRATALANDTSDELPLSTMITAGAISGGMTSLVLTPIELVKCRMQAPIDTPLERTLASRAKIGLSSPVLSPFTVIRDVFHREGLRGFWRGQLGTFLRETGGTAAWFGGYEATSLYLKRRMAKQQQHQGTRPEDIELPLSSQMLSGAIAGMSYNFLFFPADTIKSKIQTGELTHVRPTFVSVGKELWRVHGLKGLYRGCGITVARSAPSSALIFTIVENLKKTFA